MGLKSLELILQRAIDSVPPELEKGAYTFEAWLLYRKPKINAEAMKKLINEFKDNPELSIFDGKMRFFANFGNRLDYETLAKWLVFRGRLVGINEALDNLEKYLKEASYEILEIKALGGIEIERSISLANNIELVPFSEILDSYFKITLQTPRSGPGPFYGPSAALVRKIEQPKIHLNPEELMEPIRTAIDYGKELEIARLCLSLMNVAPVGFGSWLDMPDLVPCQQSSWGAYPHTIEVAKVRRIDQNDYEKSKEKHELFLKLSAEMQDRLKISLSRLNSAMNRHSNIDAAIDLGISLESLLMEEEEIGEFSFKLGLRAVKLLGENEQDRKRLDKIFKTLYDFRSKAVHLGRFLEKPRYEVHKVKITLEEGFRLTAKAIEKLMQLVIRKELLEHKGKIKNWDHFLLK